MGRIYEVCFTGTITLAGGDADLFSFQPADDKPIKLRGVMLSQTSELGDAAEESLLISVRRMGATFTVGSGGAVVTAAAPVDDEAGTVWGFTARANDTTVATTSGTNQVLKYLGWNVRSTPWEYVYPDEKYCPKARQGSALVLRLEAAVVDDLTFAGTATIEEE